MYDQASINGIKDLLVKNNQSLSIAESVTSGHLQAALSLADGATMFFQGGITVYNLGQKSRHLKVDPIAAESCNCVSQKITDAMALECINLFSSDWAIAITGYAAPIEELGIEELFAFISIAFRGKIIFSKKLPAHEKNPLDCQIFFTNSTLAEFQQLLKTKIQVGSEELIRN